MVDTRQIGKHPQHVFTFRGNPIGWANTKAGGMHSNVEGLRISGGTILGIRGQAGWRKQGTPLNVLQEPGGWESETMVRRYAHLAPAQLIEHSEKVATLLNGTNMAQLEGVEVRKSN